jgi:hypothetical protein
MDKKAKLIIGLVTGAMVGLFVGLLLSSFAACLFFGLMARAHDPRLVYSSLLLLLGTTVVVIVGSFLGARTAVMENRADSIITDRNDEEQQHASSVLTDQGNIGVRRPTPAHADSKHAANSFSSATHMPRS